MMLLMSSYNRNRCRRSWRNRGRLGTFLTNPSGQKVRPEARNIELEACSDLMVRCGEINLASSGRKGENQKGAFGRDDHVAAS